MKYNGKSIFVLTAVVALLAISSRAEIPSDISKLVQEEKYDAALARVDALLKDKPDDKELKDLREQIQAAMPKPSTTSTDQKSGISKLELTEIKVIYKDAMAQPDGSPQRTKIMRELLEKTGPLVKRDDNAIELWAARAQASLDLNLPIEGNDAATHLMSLGAAESDNETLLTILATLKRKGWLDQVTAKDESDKLTLIEKRKKQWIGKWTATKHEENELCRFESLLNLDISSLETTAAPKFISVFNAYMKNSNENYHTVIVRLPGDYYSIAEKGKAHSLQERGTSELTKFEFSDDYSRLTLAGKCNTQEHALDLKVVLVLDGDKIKASLDGFLSCVNCTSLNFTKQ